MLFVAINEITPLQEMLTFVNVVTEESHSGENTQTMQPYVCDLLWCPLPVT